MILPQIFIFFSCCSGLVAPVWLENQENEKVKIKRNVLLIEWPDRRSFEEKHRNALIGAVVGGVIGALALPVGLPVLGFTGGGVAGGSLAAGLQGAYYAGATTGVFRSESLRLIVNLVMTHFKLYIMLVSVSLWVQLVSDVGSQRQWQLAGA